MIKLLVVAALQLAVISALPTIYQPLQEVVEKDRVTLAWSVRGDTSGSYQFVVNVKTYENSLNPNIKGILREINKAYTRTSITDLESGTTYAATIKAVSLDGEDAGGSSTKVIFTTKGIKPPRSIQITEITDSSVIFEWSPPIGVEIDSTRIRLINNNNKQVLTYPDQPSTLTEYEVTGLSPGIPYIIQIQSVKGQKISTVTKTGLRTAVGTIDRVRMSDISPTTATAHWDQPRSEKDHKINRYEIGLIKDASNSKTETKTEIVSTPSNRPDTLRHTFNSLIPGRYYGIKVRVVYQVNGFGPWSKIIFFETKTQTVPSSPTKLSVVRAEKTTAQLRWEAPTNFQSIIEYEIQYSKLRTRPLPVVQTQGQSTEYVLTNLESGTEYTAKVRAIGQHNIIGRWSVENAIKTSGPKPVSSVTLTEITDASVRVTWTTYSGSKPTKIRVYHRITDSPSWTIQEVEGSMVAVSLSGLSPTTPYQVKVTVLDKDNVESSAVLSGLRTNINLDIISQKPTNLDLRMKSPTDLSVTFHKVSNRLVKYYRVEVRGSPVPNVPFVRSDVFPVKASDSDGLQNVVFKDMESGWNYRIVVRAIYGNDEEGEWSTPRLITTDGPRPPRFVDIVDIKDTTATVTWTSGYGESDSKPANLQYKITLYQLIGQSETKLITSHMARDGETQHTFVGKTVANTRYKAVIVTHSSSTSPRESTPKEKAFRSNSERPIAPVLGNIKVAGTEASVFWTRVPGRGDIRYYDVHLQQLGTGRAPNVEQFKTDTGLEDSYTFTNLVKGYFYEFKVRGVVSNDEIGKWLIQTFYVPEGVIKKVTDPVVVKKSAHSVTLTWNANTRPDLKLYEIELVSSRRGVTETVRTEGLANSFKLEDLHPSTTYKYKIRAVAANENEKGPWSETLEFTTGETSILGEGTSTGTVVGIVLALIAIIILIVIVVMICRKRRGGPSFEKFDSSVKFQKSGGMNGAEGGLPSQEMDDTATAIRNGKKLYI